MSAWSLWFFYRARLRAHWSHELMAAVGVIVGVGLGFAVLVANQSVVKSSDEVVRAVAGAAEWQLGARGPVGLPESTLAEVRALPAVKAAAPMLDHRGVLVYDGRTVPVNVASIDPSLARMSGRLAGTFVLGGLRALNGALVTRHVAERLGLPSPSSDIPPDAVSLEVAGRSVPLPIASQIGPEIAGAASSASIAVLPLDLLQSLTGMNGRLSRIVVEPKAGQREAARAQLARIADRLNLNLTAATSESSLLRVALGASGLLASFFAAMSALIAGLLVASAVLLTAPARRQQISNLSVDGYTRGRLAAIVASQALALGVVSSLVGVGLGWLLSGMLGSAPTYLEPAFSPADDAIVSVWPALIAFTGGVVVTLVASLPPLLDLRSSDRLAGAAGGGQGTKTTTIVAFAVIAAAAAAASAALLAFTDMGLLASALLAVATVGATPALLALAMRVTNWLSWWTPWLPSLALASLSLKGTAMRSITLAATGGVALFGSIAMTGSRADLLAGIRAYTSDYTGTADLWVVSRSDNQATNALRPGIARGLEGVPGVADVRSYYGGFHDVGDRRLWIIARPGEDRSMLAASQIVEGDAQEANARIRSGGWVAVSSAVAEERGVGIGDLFTLPTPSGDRSWRVAAVTTNLGWPPGATMVLDRDYIAAWKAPAPSAIEIDVEEAADPAEVARTVRDALGPASGVVVQTAGERAAGIMTSARQALNQLETISRMLLFGATLALAVAMGAAIWQRRETLAKMTHDGFTATRLWRASMVEALVVLAAGCVAGAAFGIAGQVGADQFISATTGFPIIVDPFSWQTVRTVLIVLGGAMLIVAVPGWRAVHFDLAQPRRGRFGLTRKQHSTDTTPPGDDPSPVDPGPRESDVHAAGPPDRQRGDAQMAGKR